MICNSCFSENWEQVFEFWGADKYESYCGLEAVWRRWNKCVECGHYQSEANYDPSRLMPVYKKGYRAEPFRGSPIKEEFDAVMALPNHMRENHSRVHWINMNLGYSNQNNLLDVGSGLGVFPFEMEGIGYDVICTEVNKDSQKHIKEDLGFECIDGDPGPEYFGKFGLVSMVHVLEHMQAPGLFLNAYRKYLCHSGKLFIEVPDSIEFNYLPKNHDEFNSCHLHFFSLPTLSIIVERSGYTVKKAERIFHDARKLSRIRLIADAAN
jgi:SAM-dependent methyltransferase